MIEIYIGKKAQDYINGELTTPDTTTTPNPTTPHITSTTTTTTTPTPQLSPVPVYITSKDDSPIEDINLTATIWYKGKEPDGQKTIQITSLPYSKSLTEGFAYDYLDTPLTIKFTFSKGILTVNKNGLFEPVTSGKEITISKAKEFKYTLGPTTPNTNTTPNPTTPNITSTTTLAHTEK